MKEGFMCKIYVAIPSTALSGGGESMHQFVSACIEEGYDAYFYYYDAEDYVGMQSKFSEYSANVVYEIEDISSNILIVPEVCTHLLSQFLHIKKVIWWLSLQFFLEKNHLFCDLGFSSTEIYCGVREYIFKKNVGSFWLFPLWGYRYVKYRFGFPFKSNRLKEIGYADFHMYNCEYARQYIVRCDVDKDKMQYLCGPLNEKFFSGQLDFIKENIVIYNPAKSDYFTRTVIEKLKKLNVCKVVPLCNMSFKEMVEIYSRAKVYMDFGSFPGPERMPREAVLFGCNLIVGKRGAAKNNIDVPIPEEFKFSFNISNIQHIVSKIQSMLLDYEADLPKFDVYRLKVLKQKEIFSSSVHDVIAQIKNK